MSELARIVVENAARSAIMLRIARRKHTTDAERSALYRASVAFDEQARAMAELVIAKGLHAERAA